MVPIEDLIFSGGGGFLFGILAGYAIKKVMKIAAIIIGLFVVALAYLSYKGLLDVKWASLENVTRYTLSNAYEQTFHILNSTSAQFAAHPSIIAISGLPVATGVGFVPGLMMGLKRGRIGGENKRMSNSKHGKLTNFLLKIHILEEGSYREDIKRMMKRS